MSLYVLLHITAWTQGRPLLPALRNISRFLTIPLISILNHNVNIIGFTETLFNSVEDSNLIDLENYTKIDPIRPNRTGGGVSMFIDSKHNFTQRTDLNIKTTDCYSVFIEIPIKNIIVVIVYKPDYVAYEDFISQIELALDTITKEKKRKEVLSWVTLITTF